jgi:hypothetical protein
MASSTNPLKNNVVESGGRTTRILISQQGKRRKQSGDLDVVSVDDAVRRGNTATGKRSPRTAETADHYLGVERSLAFRDDHTKPPSTKQKLLKRV